MFVLVTFTPDAGEAQALVLNFSTVFPEQVGGVGVLPTQLATAEDVVFGGELVDVTDQGNIPGAFTFEQGITFDAGEAVPEPSTGLLAGLAGLALLARRRR